MLLGSERTTDDIDLCVANTISMGMLLVSVPY